MIERLVEMMIFRLPMIGFIFAAIIYNIAAFILGEQSTTAWDMSVRVICVIFWIASVVAAVLIDRIWNR